MCKNVYTHILTGVALRREGKEKQISVPQPYILRWKDYRHAADGRSINVLYVFTTKPLYFRMNENLQNKD